MILDGIWYLVIISVGSYYTYGVASRIQSSTVVTVFGVYFGPHVSPLYATLVMKRYY